MFVPELTNTVIIHNSWINFFMAIAFYWVLLVLGFLLARLLKRVIKNPLLFFFIYAIITGSFGLFVVEWSFVGNSPWQNPSAIQFGMFVYWVGLFMFSLMLSKEDQKFRPLQKSLLKFYIIYSVIHLVISLLFSPDILLYIIPPLWTLVYTLFVIYYRWYIKIAKSIRPSKSF